MNEERFRERLDDFRAALDRLKDALSRPEDEFLRDSAIQRFEFTYELAWKAMKLWLERKDIDVRNPKDTLRAALEQGLVSDGNGWTDMHEKRNLTSHTYRENLAKDVYAFLKADAVRLFEALEATLQAPPS